MTFLNKRLDMKHFKEFIEKREAYFSNKISYNDEFGYFDSKKLLFDFLSSGLNYQAGKIAAELNAWNEFGRFILPGDVYETKINEMKILYLRQKYIEELNRKTSAETEFVHVDFDEEEFNNEVERYEIHKNLDFEIFWTNKIKKFTKEEIQDDILYHACVASSSIIDKYITLYINREFEEDLCIEKFYELLNFDYYIKIKIKHKNYYFKEAKEYMINKYNQLLIEMERIQRERKSDIVLSNAKDLVEDVMKVNRTYYLVRERENSFEYIRINYLRKRGQTWEVWMPEYEKELYYDLDLDIKFEPINENDRVFTTGTFIDIMGIEEDDPEYKKFIYGKIEDNIDKILSYPTVEFRKYK